MKNTWIADLGIQKNQWCILEDWLSILYVGILSETALQIAIYIFMLQLLTNA